MSMHELDDIDHGELGLKDFAAGSANANITAETEVARIRERIKENTSFPNDPRVVKAAEAVFLVALRSPARHQEVENLRLNDILYEDPKNGRIAELFLRPWGSHTLKSGASVRRIDFKTQFRADERDAIESWIRMRTVKTDDLDANKRIFHWPGTDRGATCWDKIKAVVFGAMREVTRDSSFRLHHLRHATCSKMFVESMLRQFVLSGGKIKKIPEDRWPFQLLGGESLRALMEKDARALCGTSSFTRKAQYATAQRLGHSGTDVLQSCLRRLAVLCTRELPACTPTIHTHPAQRSLPLSGLLHPKGKRSASVRGAAHSSTRTMASCTFSFSIRSEA